MLEARTKKPLGGVKVATGIATQKQASKLATRIIKPGHRAIVKRGNVFDIYVY